MHTLEQTETVSLDEYLIGNKQATYMLRVAGHKFIERGIYEGDILLVERGRTANIGDLVLVWDSGFTIKDFCQAFFPDAVVVAVIRKYGKK